MKQQQRGDTAAISDNFADRFRFIIRGDKKVLQAMNQVTVYKANIKNRIEEEWVDVPTVEEKDAK